VRVETTSAESVSKENVNDTSINIVLKAFPLTLGQP